MNAKLIEATLGMMARMVPLDQWDKIIGEINELVRYARSIDDRLKRIEALADRVTFLESVVQNNVEGAGAEFAEKAMWLANGGAAIVEALAPAKPGAINGRGNENSNG